MSWSRPADREVIAAAAFFHQGFDVILLPRHQRNRGAFLRGVFVPFATVRPVGVESDADAATRLVVGREPQFDVVVARDPEGVAASRGRGEKTAHALTIVLGNIGWCLERRECAARRRRGANRNRGYGRAAHVVPHIARDGLCFSRVRA